MQAKLAERSAIIWWPRREQPVMERRHAGPNRTVLKSPMRESGTCLRCIGLGCLNPDALAQTLLCNRRAWAVVVRGCFGAWKHSAGTLIAVR